MSDLNKIINKVDLAKVKHMKMSDWFDVLRNECQVYQFENGQYLAKRFSQIHYVTCAEDIARSILFENLHTILLNKYFVDKNDDERFDIVKSIVNTFMTNLSTVLATVTFMKSACTNTRMRYIQNLPNGCVAFKNGVYDFRNDCWFFKYDTIELDTGLNLIDYSVDYIVRYYFNFNFEPLGIAVKDFELNDFVQAMRELDDVQPNLCFELVYNMSFNDSHQFDIKRFEHLCEILGYTCCSTLVQQFSLIFGAGQNGKDSLFHGCFSPHIIPRPSGVSLDMLVDNQFSIGSLEGRCHNINLELSPRTFRDVSILKALTGGDEINIERKGVQSYIGTINCKCVFAGNVQNDIKFTDTSNGFLRRVNVFNVHYTWDAQKRFMQRGKYYDTTFTIDDLKYDTLCATMYIYLAMFGLKIATNNFKTDFTFTRNEWNLQYADVDSKLKESVENIRIKDLFTAAAKNKAATNAFATVLYSSNRKMLWKEAVPDTAFSFPSKDAYQKCVNPDSLCVEFYSVDKFVNSSYDYIVQIDGQDEVFEEHLGEQFVQTFDECFISLKYLQELVGFVGAQRQFTLALQKIFGMSIIERMTGNQPYVRCNFQGRRGHIQILK